MFSLKIMAKKVLPSFARLAADNIQHHQKPTAADIQYCLKSEMARATVDPELLLRIEKNSPEYTMLFLEYPDIRNAFVKFISDNNLTKDGDIENTVVNALGSLKVSYLVEPTRLNLILKILSRMLEHHGDDLIFLDRETLGYLVMVHGYFIHHNLIQGDTAYLRNLKNGKLLNRLGLQIPYDTVFYGICGSMVDITSYHSRTLGETAFIPAAVCSVLNTCISREMSEELFIKLINFFGNYSSVHLSDDEEPDSFDDELFNGPAFFEAVIRLSRRGLLTLNNFVYSSGFGELLWSSPADLHAIIRLLDKRNILTQKTLNLVLFASIRWNVYNISVLQHFLKRRIDEASFIQGMKLIYWLDNLPNRNGMPLHRILSCIYEGNMNTTWALMQALVEEPWLNSILARQRIWSVLPDDLITDELITRILEFAREGEYTRLIRYIQDEILEIDANHQNTHTASVHESTSLSALRLNLRYESRLTEINQIPRILNALKTALLSLETIQNEHRQILFEFFSALNIIEFSDPVSGISIQRLLCLAYFAVTDREKATATPQDAFLRLALHLCKIAREYNNPDSDEVDLSCDRSRMACNAGKFNQIIQALVSAHPDCEVIHITAAVVRMQVQQFTRNRAKSFLAETAAENRPNWNSVCIKMLENTCHIYPVFHYIADDVRMFIVKNYGETTLFKTGGVKNNIQAYMEDAADICLTKEEIWRSGDPFAAESSSSQSQKPASPSFFPQKKRARENAEPNLSDAPSENKRQKRQIP